MVANLLRAFDTMSKRIWRTVELCVSEARVTYIHYGPTLIFALFCIIRNIFHFIQRIQWRRSGLGKKLDEIRQGLAYDESAHILNVHLAWKGTPTDKVRLTQFLTSHNRLAHPRCVLDDDWVLAELQPDYALFLQLKEPVQKYSAQQVQFMWYDLVFETKRIAVMPLTSLQRLSIEMGPPKDDGANTTFLWSSGRCGSTLIVQMVDAADPDYLALSEPPGITDLFLFKRQMRPRQFIRNCEAALRIILKPVNGKTKFYIKPIYFQIALAEDFHKLLPKARMYYLYRTPLRTVWSLEKAFARTPFFFLKHLALLTNQWALGERMLGFHRNPIVDRMSNRFLGNGYFDGMCIIWASNLISYQEQSKKFDFPCILYDHLFENPLQFCSDILAFSGINLNRVEYALALLKTDSQDGSVFSQSVLKGLPATPFTPSRKAQTDRFCDALNLPRFEMETRKPLSSPVSMPIESYSPNVDEFVHKFMTDSSQLPSEIMQASSGYSINKFSAKQQISESLPRKETSTKSAQWQPYYKPLPLQVIFSRH